MTHKTPITTMNKKEVENYWNLLREQALITGNRRALHVLSYTPAQYEQLRIRMREQEPSAIRHREKMLEEMGAMYQGRMVVVMTPDGKEVPPSLKEAVDVVERMWELHYAVREDYQEGLREIVAENIKKTKEKWANELSTG